MMQAPRLLSSAVVLHFFLCACSVPVPEGKASARHKAAGGWLQKPHPYPPKKRVRLPQGQDTLKEATRATPGNISESWSRPRCGVPDFPAEKRGVATGRQRHKRFVLFGGRWDKTDLTYKIVRFPWQMSKEKVRSILHQANQVWSDVTPLTFTEVNYGRADIIIDFTRYWHGDSLPFDGPGGILAHAFFPRTHREGDIHFDYDETWTVGNGIGTNLLQVAAHEFGHVLGLQHSQVPGAVMSPFYSFAFPLALSEDDRRGIQSLYGQRLAPEPRPTQARPAMPRPTHPTRPTRPHITETNEILTSAPDTCYTKFDAVSMIRGELFFFRSGYVWRIRDGHLQMGYPALASRHWPGIPDYVDAAFEDESGNIWFFQGENYWVFDAGRRITGPDPVHRLGLPVSHIQAALLRSDDHTHRVYFFRSGSYWRFSPRENRVDTPQPRHMQDWRGVPANIDGAFQDRQGYIHFLSGRQYWKVDPVTQTVLPGYPRGIGMDFFGCPPNNYR
ncbi:stromelysin-3-like [Conger conger]|uniref:stromelysin-3-like n=1 Tax=Conger conger TaxID=82655 RepID=UPI002A599928|nr:stromelysin-3-like [Conger conger]